MERSIEERSPLGGRDVGFVDDDVALGVNKGASGLGEVEVESKAA